jgi:hypothetical protein
LDIRWIKIEDAEENCMLGSLIICTLHEVLLGYQKKEDEMLGECSAIREMRSAYNICLEILKEREHSEDLGVIGG